ncbi:MAG: ribonuclease PH [Lentisphaerae bacterium GWF2_45_14]|nr:MAG: ribonuclease PH [Lentisphaerae bacterium GWF2_45_14]
MNRPDNRKNDQLRRVKITKDYLNHPTGSVLIECGGTKVICAVSIDPGVPPWMRAQNVPGGWVTSEYGMLPGSTHDRSRREANAGKQGGRTMEIQRLIGRSFRSVIDLEALGPNTVYIDCDVIDADGGTRCASISGASVALQIAFGRLLSTGRLKKNPMRENIAAVSVGIVKNEILLDLCYEEDSGADVDMNIVMTESGKFIEVQGTAEKEPFSFDTLQDMLGTAKKGLETLFSIQGKTLNDNPIPHNRSKKFGNLGELLDNVTIQPTQAN